MKNQQEWLTLKAAAEQLSVHTTTLRRWADRGDIPVMLTPGGHRRFSAQDIAAFAESRHGLRPKGSQIEKVWAERALVQTRENLVGREGASWLATTDDHAREQKRRMGGRLMGVLMQYIALDENDPAAAEILHEAEEFGRQYGRLIYSEGITLTDALRATMFFRDSLVEAAIDLPATTRVRADSNNRLLHRINTILNHVQLAIAQIYENTDA